ncbi:uncharacterized protein UV8b_00564 [Ustilaginoidea virens]|uniref:Uncharacterized protein n=1 Tax=Ustilaginoidea virens TaxID=1159556 RepID=A0A8E5MDK9_USTVR|nr:uncharacterized protein UV8b_00564 [Ustilaginoidea virens]QUC16323.1 hypothetical protein UV8b_00564 [Ustilaginoidea virens]
MAANGKLNRWLKIGHGLVSVRLQEPTMAVRMGGIMISQWPFATPCQLLSLFFSLPGPQSM